jgi:hypothetical protein
MKCCGLPSWTLTWEAQKERGLRIPTLTPEFGPPAYQHTLPFTGAPVSNVAEICDWQTRRQTDNFARFLRRKSSADRRGSLDQVRTYTPCRQ